MEQKTLVYNRLSGMEELKKKIDKEFKSPWYVHEIVSRQRGAAGLTEDYLVVYRKD